MRRNCEGCHDIASHLVNIPWTHVDTFEKGYEWTPLCPACLPDGEDWDTVSVSEAAQIDAQETS